VYAVTNERSHARAVRDRLGGDTGGTDDADGADGTDETDDADDTDGDRLVVLEADVRSLPIAADSVDVVTAHGLFNLLPPAALDPVVDELTRVAAPGCHLVVDDYDPLPDGAAVRDLFAVENAATELAHGRPALTFYPAGVLRRLFVGAGWTFDREHTLLEPVPWTPSHVEAHATAARAAAARVPGELGERLRGEVDRLVGAVGEESVGRMYSVAFRLPD
jgi:hypothetical protein